MQPQYLLWIMPLVIVLIVKWRGLVYPLGLLSASGLLFSFSLEGPQAFLYPLAMYTPLYNPQQLINSLAAYQNLQGTLAPYLRQDLCTVFGAIGFLGLIITIWLLVRNLWAVKDGVE
jgi:hypothetical protein